jgi:hypothetical protein
MNNLIIKANENLKRAIEVIKNNHAAFESIDLKLHYTSYYSWRDAETDFPEIEEDMNDLFYDFCDVSYMFMEEDFKENGYEWEKRQYIGRTSSFYLSGYQIRGYRTETEDIDDILYNIIEQVGYPDIPDIEDGQIVINDYTEDCIDNLEYISSEEFIQDFNKEISGILKMYEYIKDFKDNQVEYFKEYLQGIQDDILYQREQEEKHNLDVWLAGVSAIVA